MTHPLVIGFSGKLGSGKDYIAKHILPSVLEMLCGIDFDIRVVAVADQLKYELAARDSTLTYDLMYVTKTTEVRTKLQQYGTEQGRDKYGDDMWLQALSIRMEVDRQRHIGPRPIIFVLTDIRYENEANFVSNKLHGLLIRVDAPGRNRTRLEQEGIADVTPHRSETALDTYEFPYTIYNDYGHESTISKQLSHIVMDYIKMQDILALTDKIIGHFKKDNSLKHELIAYLNRNIDSLRKFCITSDESNESIRGICSILFDTYDEKTYDAIREILMA